MDIFETDRARIKRRLQAFLPILLLAAVCLIFYLGITGAGRETVTKEQTTLKRALEQGAITFGTRCMFCLGCIHKCPVHAIDYKGRGRKNGYYTCPSLEEVLP